MGSRHPHDVLGCFFPDNIDDIVDGNDSHELVLLVDDGNGEDVIPLSYLGNLFLIHIGPYAYYIGNHDFLQLLGGGNRDELSEGDDPNEMPPVVHHVNVEDHLSL